MSKRIEGGSPTPPQIIEVPPIEISLSDEFQPISLEKEIDLLGNTIFNIIGENRKAMQPGHIEYEKVALEVLSCSVTILKGKVTTSTEDISNIDKISSNFLKNLEKMEISGDFRKAIEKTLSSINTIATDILNGKKELSHVKEALKYARDLLVITEKNQPPKGDSFSNKVQTLELDELQYTTHDLLKMRYDAILKISTLYTMLLKIGEKAQEMHIRQSIMALYNYFFEEYQGTKQLLGTLIDLEEEDKSKMLIGTLVDANDQDFHTNAPDIFNQLLEKTTIQIQKINPHFGKSPVKIVKKNEIFKLKEEIYPSENDKLRLETIINGFNSIIEWYFQGFDKETLETALENVIMQYDKTNHLESKLKSKIFEEQTNTNFWDRLDKYLNAYKDETKGLVTLKREEEICERDDDIFDRVED